MIQRTPVTKIEQRLSTGITVRQDFKDSVRFVFFWTGFEGWEYATHGGTAFVVNFRGRPFALLDAASHDDGPVARSQDVDRHGFHEPVNSASC